LSRSTFLSEKKPFPAQVAAFLLRGISGRPIDLTATMVIVPTAGAARAIRNELARQAQGVLLPSFQLPLQAMLREDDIKASTLEQSAAWVQVLADTPRRKYAALVPPAVKLNAPEDWVGVAARLNTVCDILGEAGLVPGSAELVELCPNDASRWKEFAALHGAYLSLLAKSSLADANALRLQRAQSDEVPKGIDRVVVALVPDLPPVAAQWLSRLRAKGIAVDVLSWDCGEVEARFDEWGRPDTSWWTTHQVLVPADVIVPENSVREEAAFLVEFAARHNHESFSLIAADAESANALASEVAARQAKPYLPEGKPLSRTEAATILAAWKEFSASRSLRHLRPLLQLPSFARFFARQSGLTAHESAAACDRLCALKLCETLSSASEWSRAGHQRRAEDEVLYKFVAGLESLQTRKLSGRALLAELYRDEDVDDRIALELETLVEALEDGEGSSLVLSQPEAMRDALRRRHLENGRVFLPAAADEIEIRGWLEAPWTDSLVICVSGCREGSLPSGTHEDAFLPDSLRAKLGLASNASRYARDAYLLSCLLRHYGPSRLRLGYSRFGPDGEPNRPSRLLLGCTDTELPARVHKIFQPSSVRGRSAKAPSPWKLRLERPDPVTTIRVTGFKHYLECPLRFYLSQVRGLQPFDPDTREINAADYGTLLHRVLENFHKQGPAESTDEHVIAGWLDQELDRVIAWHFGRHPSPVIRVQAESMRTRLRYFAALQASERRDGWKIIESEYAVRREDGYKIGPLALSGTMDRVERHEEKGLRILDYKTFANEKSPEDTHFGPPREADRLPEASITRKDARGRDVERYWADLQLPLYRRLAAKIWPQESTERIQTGYILLPGDPDDTQVSLLDIDDTTQRRAEACAEAVAKRIAKGIFWPPAVKVKYDNFSVWFGGSDPSEVFDDASAANMGGTA